MAPPPPTAQPTGTSAPADAASSLTLLTVEEAARRLSLGRTTLYALLKTGAINSVKVGRLRRIPTEALTDYTARLIAEQSAA